MRTIDHKAFKKPKSSKRVTRKRQIIVFSLALLGVFLLANIAISVIYRGKVLPGYTIGSVEVSGKQISEVKQIIQRDLLPKQIELQYEDRKHLLTVADTGVEVDQQKTLAVVNDRPLFPIVSLVKKTHVSFVIKHNEAQIDKIITNVAPVFSLAPTNRHVAFNGTEFISADATSGFELNQQRAKTQLLRDLAAAHTQSKTVIKKLPAGDNTKDVTAEINTLNKQLQTDIQLTVAGQVQMPSRADIGAWYVPSSDSMALSDEKLQQYLVAIASSKGVVLANGGDLQTGIKYALSKQLAAHVRVADAKSSVRKTYCVAAKGVPEAQLADVAGKLALAYADVRGWNAGGAIAFDHVESGCSYTVWLTAPALMTSFGAICDDFYNCQVGTNVIINSDRWQWATEPWRKTGQDVETYRLLIINHETGHRLGLRDNNVCDTPGQPALVMMQQSIDLKGCLFNVWPLPSELAAVKSML